MTSSTMRALVHADVPGLDGLQLAEAPVPTAGPGELLIAVDYAGLNRHELFTARRRTGTEPPQILGADAAGRVAVLGEGTTGFTVGDRVLLDPTLNWPRRDAIPAHPDILGGRAPGTFAEFVAVPAANAYPVPKHLTPAEAGALGLAGVTAYRALFSVGELQAGEHVLVPGIGSGVGLLALDLARSVGAEVTVTSRSSEKLDFARSRGAARAVLSDQLHDAGLDGSIDLVVDTVGAASVPGALRTLRPGGRLVTLGATTGPDIKLSLRDLFFRQISLRGTSVGSAEEFRAMLGLVTAHLLRPVIDAVHPLTDAPDIMRAAIDGASLGKTVFHISVESQT
ncbi:quinone oxidoreductase family protein [Agromyces badenianii]|uniref:quinone oxidoreductase family protein n=1 Tax=Agromyces badenianii TaxID=2080742 RepID=UPI000D59EE6A|nr:zinc-binding dehydrogenase [Agromyces badenianii]PWC05582.1 alcohol dehydrogenase [Agromyces badenianii]